MLRSLPAVGQVDCVQPACAASEAAHYCSSFEQVNITLYTADTFIHQKCIMAPEVSR